MNTHSVFFCTIIAFLLIVGIASCDQTSPCDGFECNYGNCVVTPQGTPKCDCYPGYYGDNCPYENYDPCLVLECKNGGTCEVDSTNPRKAHCICAPGFTGSSCETADPCFNNNGGCINGTCSDSLGIVTCICFEGYSGVHCENIDYCYNVTCPPNAYCNSTTGECKCNTGYEFAPTCEQEIRAKFLGTYNATDNCAGTQTNYTCNIVADNNIQGIVLQNFGNRGINVKATMYNSTTFIITQTQEFLYTAVPPHDTIRIIAPPSVFGAISTSPDTTINFNYQYAFPGEAKINCSALLSK